VVKLVYELIVEGDGDPLHDGDLRYDVSVQQSYFSWGGKDHPPPALRCTSSEGRGGPKKG
jgi:hypothetical protein